MRHTCLMLLNLYNPSPAVAAHCRAVARGAAALASVLEDAGYSPDICFIVRAGLLHDIAKGQPEHAQEGARIARRHGFYKEADYIAGHTDYDPDRGGRLSESALLYLADMLLDGTRLTQLTDRRERVLRLYPGEDTAIHINRRFKAARAIYRAFLETTGKSPGDILEQVMTVSTDETEKSEYISPAAR